MLSLLPNECRVLGVLVEKAFTVPASYPLTLNAVVVGSNQKNNRAPLTNIGEDAALDALDGLRRKGLAVEVFLSGSRAAKYKHNAREGLKVTTEQLVVLVELLLRGPQTAGSLRQNASRMTPIESLEKTIEIVESLIKRGPDDEGGDPLVRELPPEGRARRFAQLLCPNLHPLDLGSESSGHGSHDQDNDEASSGQASGTGAGNSAGGTGGSALAARVEQLERETAELRASIQKITSALGM